MVPWCRLLLGADALGPEQAERVARAEAAARGWPWKEPVSRQRTLRGYRFRTAANMRGGNVMISVRADTGQVTKGSYARR